jgi:hypothetical protein
MARNEKQPWFCACESGLSYYPSPWQGDRTMIVYVVLLTLSVVAAGLTALMSLIAACTTSEFGVPVH